ncbi:MAG: DnaJ domain-containing protein [Deltaproteobacteria bacterium]|nr:DnaJ domain-containing protein [Deltaproteobacteria bacterium]
MDAVAAFAAPFVKDLDVASLSGFLGRRGLRVVHAHDGVPFGILLKSLLHGRLGTELRCARVDLRQVEDSETTRAALQPWINLAGLQGAFPPPPGYYLFRGPTLVGFHPELPDADRQASRLVTLGARGFVRLLQDRDLDRAGRVTLQDEPELDLVRFFEEVAQGWVPRRAPAASDRRTRQDRRGGARDGKSARRARERLEADLDSAFRLLGVSRNASMKRIKSARNRLMRDNHPDRLANQPERQAAATRMTVRINEAYTAIRKVREEHGDRA